MESVECVHEVESKILLQPEYVTERAQVKKRKGAREGTGTRERGGGGIQMRAED